VSRRRVPRPASTAFRTALRQAAPQTRLAAVQSVWDEVVGERMAAAARPVSERDGTLTIACMDTVWVQELDLMQEQLQRGLRERLGEDAPRTLRFRLKADGD
jgi:predicted nucleic acid-binding Zn ribbon protein